MLEFSKEFGRIAGELLDPLLWFLMFALAVGTRRRVLIVPAALLYVVWATLMLALAEIGYGGWSLATSNFLERLIAALICGVAARMIVKLRRRVERRWADHREARRGHPPAPDAADGPAASAPG